MTQGVPEERITSTLTMHEMEVALCKLKGKKLPDADGITNEMPIGLDEKKKKRLIEIFSRC